MTPLISITVTGNFTVEPIEPILTFWLRKLAIPGRVEFLAYNQLFPALISPDSALSSTQPGANMLLVRVEDWGRERSGAAEICSTIRQSADDFVRALGSYALRTKRQTLLFIAPISARASGDSDLVTICQTAERQIGDVARALRGFTVLDGNDVADLFPLEIVEDLEADRQGHVPFTSDYWTALGTVLARRFRALHQPPFKVIVTDADNSLWGGVVGEVGADGIDLSEPWLLLQRHLKSKKQQGMLLALASKNETADVEAVFARREMLLTRDDFVAWKIGWEPKSASVLALAKELDLGLDSFVFLDDNPVECAEVSARCPSVTVLRVPSDPATFSRFLKHTWVFDLPATTSVDEKRTELYRQQTERHLYREATTDFRDFIEGLRLEVTLNLLSAADYERAAQLTQRTNQFNNSGDRYTPVSLAEAVASGRLTGWMVQVRDRFGDYGEVGLVLFHHDDRYLRLDSFLLSCRVLGKGVEHRVLAAVGHEAVRCGAQDVLVPFVRHARNQPLERFFRSLDSCAFEGGAFILPAAAAKGVAFDPTSASSTDVEEKAQVPSDAEPRLERPDFAELSSLDSVDKIRDAIVRGLARPRSERLGEAVLPRTPEEAQMAAIWREVLHLPVVGVIDTFTALGGRSLDAVAVASRATGIFGTRIPLSAVMLDGTVAGLCELLRDLSPATSFEPPAVIQPTLSAAQERLWFLDHFISNKAAYNIAVARRIDGPLQVDALERAFASVVHRHEVLRSRFVSVDGQGHVELVAAPAINFTFRSAENENDAARMLDEEARRPFDLADGSPARCLAVALSPTSHLLALTVHHIVADGWSVGILLRDLAYAYGTAVNGEPPTWTPLPTSYFALAAWQKERVRSGALDHELSYWREELHGSPELLELPTDMPRPAVVSYQGGCVRAQLGPQVKGAIDRLASTEAGTPFSVLLAAWTTMLCRYSGQDDIVVGVPVAGRHHQAAEAIVGCFVNTIAVRTRLDSRSVFRTHLRHVREKLLAGLSHQELPLEVLVGDLGLTRDLSHTPIFQVVLVLQDTPTGDFDVAGTRTKTVEVHNGGAKFDLVLELTPRTDGYAVALEYNSNLFFRETVERIVGHFTQLLTAACAAPETELADLPMMSAEEFQATLALVNQARRTFPVVECLHHWFERRATMSPQAVAVTFEQRALTYAEVNEKANTVAHALMDFGVSPGTLVGICLDRTADLVIAIIAVLKAGGAYVPIDLTYPADRLAFMLRDAKAPVLLTERALVPSLPRHDGRTVCIEDVSVPSSRRRLENPDTRVTVEDPAYVIYTSGSTGRPKGCVVTHRNVARLMLATEDWYAFNDSDVWTLFHSAAFDFSVWEIWGALLYGGRLVIVPFMVSRSPEAFYQLLASERVTVLNQTPSAFRQLMQAEETLGVSELSLRYVIFGGEALEPSSLRPWFARHGDRKPLLVNMYGITETTVHVTYRQLSHSDLRSGSVIGVPIPDLELYVLDERKRPVPIGVPGELYVGGPGLAQGYLDRPELTAERFIANHITGRRDARLYRTGDRARLLPGRDVEYLGRVDHQVKIRGFRIELGEIEAVLADSSLVREAVVLAREDAPGTKQLVAYVVAQGGTPDLRRLRDHLKVKLPEYMVPAVFVFLDQLPLTENGKVDRRALPAPTQHRPELGPAYVAPRTSAERSLADMWARVLRVDRVGVHDNFFELGGDSILSMHVIAAARRAGLRITLQDLFAHQNVEELAMTATAADGHQSPSPEDASADVPLTPIQRWFFEQDLSAAAHYNQAFVFEVARQLDPTLLGRAFDAVQRCHQALRLRFHRSGEEWRQRVEAEGHAAVAFEWEDLSAVPNERVASLVQETGLRLHASLDIEAGPLWRAVYLDAGSVRRGRLVVAVHHLAVDGVSWRPLVEDIERAYLQLESQQEVQLEPPMPFARWANGLQAYASTDSAREELSYWQDVVGRGAETHIDDPVLSHLVANPGTEGAASAVTLTLDQDKTHRLLTEAPAAYHTQINDILLTALTRAWSQAGGGARLFASIEGHGREALFDDADLSRTIGWFTSLFPVCFDGGPTVTSWDPGAALKATKEQLRRMPRHGVGFGVLRYLVGSAELASVSEPALVFNYLGQMDRVLSDSAIFRFSSDTTGPWHAPRQRRRHAIEVDCEVTDGRLRARWAYPAGVGHEDAISRLAHAFMRALDELIVHCSSPGVGGRTSSDFPLAGLDQAALDRLVGSRQDIEDIYPLTPIQTLFYSASSDGRFTTFDQWHSILRGPLDESAFRRAWGRTVAHHPILRSSVYSEEAAEPLQLVVREADPPWTVEDWRALSRERQEVAWESLLRADQHNPLDLSRAPVMRFALVRTADSEWRFLWSVPALLLDGWSWPLVFRDVSVSYQADTSRRAVALPPTRAYRRYVEWLRGLSQEDAKAYWKAVLAGCRGPAEIPSDPPAASSGERYASVALRIGEDATNALQTRTRTRRLTIGAVIHGVWAILLSRQSGSDDVVFGAAFAGRPARLPGAETIVGPFVNNLPVRVKLDGSKPVRTLLAEVHQQLMTSAEHQFLPLRDIQRVSAVPWHVRLFESMVVVQNYLVDDAARTLGRDVQIDAFAGPIHTNYPVMLVVVPESALRVQVVFDRQRIAEATAQRLVNDVRLGLEAIGLDDERTVSEVAAGFSMPSGTAIARERPASAAQAFAPPRTKTERAIGRVWGSLFGIEQVGIDWNFFDLGGQSMLLIQVHESVQQELGTHFPIVAMFEHPTVRLLSAYLDNRSDTGNQTRVKIDDRARLQRSALAKIRSSVEEKSGR